MWFGFLALFLGAAFLGGAAGAWQWPFIVTPGFMALIGYLVMKNLVWDLVDEVYDCGEFLLIRNRGTEEHLPLSNIMNVSMSTSLNPPRLSLRLVMPGQLGPEIVFSPVRPFSLNPFARNPIADDLMVRVDRARSKRPV